MAWLTLTNSLGAAEARLAPGAVEALHASQGSQALWQDQHYQELIEALRGLEDHGLDPSHYHLERLIELSEQTEERDQLASDAWFSAAAHMFYGKLDPLTLEPDWTAVRRVIDLSEHLRAAWESDSIADSLQRLAPTQPGYRALVEEYAALRVIEEQGVHFVPAGPALRAGMSGDRVLALQKRLVQLQYLDEASSTGILGPQTDAALRLFQTHNDLDDDGIAGPATLRALNRNQAEKLGQLRVNLERWRWLPEDLGERHLRVNIAAFTVAAWNRGVVERTHLTIVGKTYRRTPVFSDEIEYLVLNPWWEVPHSIATLDKLPLFQQQPELVSELGFVIMNREGSRVDAASIDWQSLGRGNFPYRLRQSPGENNALGQIKIMFPNQHSVYLHDTPTRGLFAQRQRAFSSGCLRTQYPLELAEWLLSETPGWSQERLQAAVAAGDELRINLARRVPVHILYFTVVSEPGIGVRYLDDIYQRDAAVLAGLQDKPF